MYVCTLYIVLKTVHSIALLNKAMKNESLCLKTFFSKDTFSAEKNICQRTFISFNKTYSIGLFSPASAAEARAAVLHNIELEVDRDRLSNDEFHPPKCTGLFGTSKSSLSSAEEEEAARRRRHLCV